MKLYRFLPVIAAAIICQVSFETKAQSDSVSVESLRPVTSAYMLEAGSSHLTDTYLTPLNYEGWAAAMAYERLQAPRFNPSGAIMQLRGRLALDRAMNPARNAAMWNLDLDIDWGVVWRLRPSWLPSGFALSGGFNTGIDLGALYLARNGNNPVTAKAAWTVGVTGMAVYNFRLGCLPVTLRYQPSLPLTGVFFSPDYGELYYEIYLGNDSGLVHGAWPGNYFRLDNLLTLDLRFKGATLRLGYHNEVYSGKVNNIVSGRTVHAFVIGLANEWISLSPRRKISTDAKIISAIY